MDDLNPPQKHTERFQFTGDAGEYFGIWFVNNTLTWITLGIYSAWAKVRNLQYFYGNTELAGGRFQFTASPLKILRSRIIAVALLILYVVVSKLETLLAQIILGVMVVAYFVFMPLLTVMVMSFRLRYSEWRGIRFKFNRDYKGAYKAYLPAVAVMGLLGLSFFLPTNSLKVEEYLGLDHYEWKSDADADASAETSMSEDQDLGEESSEETYTTADQIHYDEPSSDEVVDESSDYAAEESADYVAEESTGTTEDESDNADVTFTDDTDADLSDDEEQEEKNYVNPYLFIPSGLLALLFVVLLPYFEFINTRFLSRNVSIGNAPFSFVGHAKDYYAFYGKWLLSALVVAALWFAEIKFKVTTDAGLLFILIILSGLYILASIGYFKSRRYNVWLNNTCIDHKHQLRADTPVIGMCLLMITNSLAVMFTFGLMGPWAKIRTARFLLDHSWIEVDGSLDDFIAAQSEESNALGEEVADAFDIELIG